MSSSLDCLPQNASSGEMFDPFVYKYRLTMSKRKVALDHFRDFLGYDLTHARDTTMIYLLLKEEVSFTKIEMMRILGLQADMKVDRAIFNKFREVVDYVARVLKERIPVRLLLEMPYTDISRICYGIATKFESIFFVPVNGGEHQFDFWWTDRFNSVWPVVCELNKAYNELE